MLSKQEMPLKMKCAQVHRAPDASRWHPVADLLEGVGFVLWELGVLGSENCCLGLRFGDLCLKFFPYPLVELEGTNEGTVSRFKS